VPATEPQIDAVSRTERIVLLALNRALAHGVSSTTHLWLQKVAFLFLQRMEETSTTASPSGTGYIAYDYGPYSDEVAGAVETLCDDRLLAVATDKTLRTTSAGKAVAGEIESAKPRAVQAMDSILDTVGDLSEKELILYVYSTNPEWARESNIRHLLADADARRRLARKLYERERVTAAKAALIAGVPVDQFATVVPAG
jgi:uncharacterized protein YwgA